MIFPPPSRSQRTNAIVPIPVRGSYLEKKEQSTESEGGSDKALSLRYKGIQTPPRAGKAERRSQPYRRLRKTRAGSRTRGPAASGEAEAGWAKRKNYWRQIRKAVAVKQAGKKQSERQPHRARERKARTKREEEMQLAKSL